MEREKQGGSAAAARIVRFGDFETDLDTGELRYRGLRRALQEKPFEVLAVLLERPGELVSRRELQERLWPPGTHVELEDGLNTAVSKLRQALGDTASTPRFIETVPRRGYRFVAPCSPRPESDRQRPRRLGAWIAAGAIALTSALLWIWWAAPGREESPVRSVQVAPPVSPTSVAVLPFDNLSGDPEDEYLSDGMTAELIARLTKLERLTVVSRRAVMKYKGSRHGPSVIAGDLRVATVLEGSVRRDGDRIRISCQLIDAHDERTLWSETFQGDVDDIFGVQVEVAEQIAAALEVELSPEERRRIERSRTTSFTAYDFYLRGLQHYRRFNAPDNESAIGLFERALEEDPSFALAHAGLADAFYARAMRYDFPRAEWLEANLRQARKAVEIDDTLAEAHKSLGVALAGQGRFEESLEAFERALELRPGYAMAINNIGAAHEEMGRLDEALRWYRRAAALNPVDAFFHTNIGGLYAVLGDDTAAFEWLERALELEPESVHARVWLGALRLYRGEFAELLELAGEILAMSPEDPTGLSLAGSAHWLMGNRDQAEELLRRAVHDGFFTRNDIALGQLLWQSGRREEAERLLGAASDDLRTRVAAGSRSSEHHVQIAEIEAIRGNSDAAVQALRRAAELDYPFVRSLPRNPSLADLIGDPRVQALVGDLERRVAAMRERARDR